MLSLLFYCRPGFERETAQEVTALLTANRVPLEKVFEQPGFVVARVERPWDADRIARSLPFTKFIFARQMLVVSEELTDLDLGDRITPVVGAFAGLSQYTDLGASTEVFVEVPETEEAKELLTFCRKFTVPLRQELRKQGYLPEYNPRTQATTTHWAAAEQGITLHVLFTKNSACYVGYSYNHNHCPHYMGIKRLKFPDQAPSRSTLKLEDAILSFLTREEEAQRLQRGMQAVDLGACPGGWTYQLVRRGLFVYCVDHGAMAESLHETGRIEHCSEDGFKFVPPKGSKIQWLVCDMIEQPQRVANLMSKWLVNGWCQETIFNLKLPMKNRYQEIESCLKSLQKTLTQAGLKYKMQAKHLYHDRLEITVHVQILSR